MSSMHPGGGAWRHIRSDRSVMDNRIEAKTLRRVLGFARPHRILISIFLFLTVIDAAMVVVMPLLVQRIVDDGILAGNNRMVTLLALAMAGVAQHSNYRDAPLDRLANTSRYVGTTIYGTQDDARHAVAMVKRVHERVTGVAPDGRPYHANDPHLLTWVHSTLVDSFLRAYRRYGAHRLSDADADRYVDEQAVLAELFGAEPAARSVAELRASAGRDTHHRLFYVRRGTPTQWSLADALTELEPGAEGTFLYPSGVTAIAAALLSVLSPGDELLLVDSAYDPTRSMATGLL